MHVNNKDNYGEFLWEFNKNSDTAFHQELRCLLFVMMNSYDEFVVIQKLCSVSDWLESKG